MRSSDRAHFLEAADEMRRAMNAFLEAWDKILRVYPDLNNTINEGYPFSKDFMELVGDVHGWYHNLEEGLKSGPLEWRPRKRR
jgi:hypothetical protein